MGKTTLAHALATLLGLAYQRVQFTSDMLPADLLGLSIYDQANASFTFHPGPIFTQVLLADEINRGSPRTQSALLEAMAERQISTDGITRTRFFDAANMNTDAIKQSTSAMTPEEVALYTVRALDKNRAIIIPGRRNRWITRLPRLLSRWMTRKIAASVNKSYCPR